MMSGRIEIVRADELRVGDVFSTDGAIVVELNPRPWGFVDVVTGVPGRVQKRASLPADHPCPLWRESART